MPNFLELPLEIRNHVYDILLWERLDPQLRGVMVVTEPYVKRDLPLRSYRGLLRACRQTHYEVKEAIRHMVASKQLDYDLTMTFSHGRPFFSLTWSWFPALSPTINHLCINVDLRTQEPMTVPRSTELVVPDEHELAFLLEEMPNNFAEQLFGYLAVLLKSLASLLVCGNPTFRILYTECVTLNLRRPTEPVLPTGHINPIYHCRRVPLDAEEARELHNVMQDTLKATSNWFDKFHAEDCDTQYPLIQIGSLRFATEGVVWAKGHNLLLPDWNTKLFRWIKY
jgi:hypothetical protein